MIKVLIVEDEPNYSDTLEMFVDELGYMVAGTASDALSAIDILNKKHPDLILMDINLQGGISGIELVKSLNSLHHIPVIFITSYTDKETFEMAKETAPSAYITKPFDPDALERSMELAIQSAYGADENVFEEDQNAVLAPSSLFIKERNRLVKIDLKDILWVEVEDKYCMLCTKDKRFALRQPLKELAEKLDPSVFVQTHRSYLVNIEQVENIDTHLFVVRINDREIPLGKTYKDQLISRLRIL